MSTDGKDRNFSVAEYSEKTAALNTMGERMRWLLIDLLSDAEIRVHSITYRVKKYSSAQIKFSSAPEKYVSFEDLTDLLGIRIITYFPDEVDAVGALIERELNVDRDNSVDKRSLLDPDKFGYMSLHYIVTLDDVRCCLTEYKRYRDKKFELQVRSILQHAWAEIEHDLGYKNKHAVPREISRRFSRLAGLLEAADEEFKSIRNDLNQYGEKIREYIQVRPTELEIDQATISAFIEEVTILSEIEESIIRESAARGASFALSDPAEAVPSNIVGLVLALGISNIGELKDLLVEYREFIETIGVGLLMAEIIGSEAKVHRGIGLSILFIARVFQMEKQDAIEVLESANVPDPETVWDALKGPFENK